MMEETVLVEHIKEVSCFVSQNLASDLLAAKSGKHSRTYVLPDGSSGNPRGYLRSPLGKDELRAAAKEGKEVSLRLARRSTSTAEQPFNTAFNAHRRLQL